MNTEIIVSPTYQSTEEPGVYSRSLENPNLPLDDVRPWEEAGLWYGSSSGVRVNASTALTYAPVWQAVNLISGDVSKLPLNVYRRINGGDGREIDRNHTAYKIIRKRANEEMHARRFWRRMMTHALIWNNAYALIVRDGEGNPVEMIPLLPDRTSPEHTDLGMIYTTEVNGSIRGYFPSQIFHIEGISITGEADCELVKKARESWSLGLAAQRLSSKFFENGGRQGGVLELPSAMRKDTRDRVEDGFRNTYENVNNAFKTVILRENAKFHAAQQSAEEVQLIPARQEQVREVARWYNLPAHKLNEASGSSVSYSSLEQLQQDYLDSALDHWLVTIASESEMKLLTREEHESDSHFVEHNTNAILRVDIKTRFETYEKGITNGVLNPDECRARENLNPRSDGDGDKYIRPLNMAVSGGETEEQDESDDDRSKLLVASSRALQESIDRATNTVHQVTRRKAKQQTPSRFRDWVNSTLKATSKERTEFRERIFASADVYSAVLGSDCEMVIERVEESVFTSLQTALIQTLEDTRNGDLLEAVSGICDIRQEITKTIVTEVLGDRND